MVEDQDAMTTEQIVATLNKSMTLYLPQLNAFRRDLYRGEPYSFFIVHVEDYRHQSHVGYHCYAASLIHKSILLNTIDLHSNGPRFLR